MCFNNYDFSSFWDDSIYFYEEYICESPTDALIEEIENELGYKFSKSYVWLMKQHNGGIPVNTCFPVKYPTSWA